MHIYRKQDLPMEQKERPFSIYVFIYYNDHRRFCLGCYDFREKLWMDNDGMVIDQDFVWCYLPIRQMRQYINRTTPAEGMRAGYQDVNFEDL